MPRVAAPRARTDDVTQRDPCSFSDLRLSAPILQGLQAAGFVTPSPIQLAAIPLGRFGVDLIAQAKSGTGKTCVFSVIALEAVNVELRHPQVLICAPTREIAQQIQTVVSQIAQFIRSSLDQVLSVHAFIGGMPIKEDRLVAPHCQIAVGTPGRLEALIESHELPLNAIRLFIADEADKLLDESFQPHTLAIMDALPVRKQLIAVSATFPKSHRDLLEHRMRQPKYVLLNPTDPALAGVRQFYAKVEPHAHSLVVQRSKLSQLLNILESIKFFQCIVFCNNWSLARKTAQQLTKAGWPAAAIQGNMAQAERTAAVAALRSFELRILVSSDLVARGVDVDRCAILLCCTGFDFV